MKVQDVMQTSVISVSDETPLKEVARLIFSLGIAGVPVVKEKKLLGIVTEHDIFSHMYPSMQDLVQDYVHAGDFEAMEHNLPELLETPVKKIMNKKVTTITSDLPLMRAQSIMMMNQFSRLLVVNTKNELVGIISKGDIFRQIVKEEIPRFERERYVTFIARYYDLMVDWSKRFEYEFPSLFSIFKKEKIESVVDIGVWTGEYSIGLVKNGVQKLLGLDHNPEMIKICHDKKRSLPDKLQEKISFKITDFIDISSVTDEKYDAAVCMGNSLPYLPTSLPPLFKGISQILREKNGVIILQLLNFEKVLKSKNRLMSFTIEPSREKDRKDHEHLFLEFFDRKGSNQLIHHVVIFDSDGKNWIYKGITSIPKYNISKEDIVKALQEAGFKDIESSGTEGEYQGEFGRLSFDVPFDKEKHDLLNVIAKR